jgi:hypothetical protein
VYLISYTDIINRDEVKIQALASFCGLDPSEKTVKKYCLEVVEDSLYRNHIEDASSLTLVDDYRIILDFSDKLLAFSGRSIVASELALRLYDENKERLNEEYLEQLQLMYGRSYIRLINVRHRLLEHMQVLSECREKADKLRLEAENLRLEKDNLKSYISTIEGSISWRLVGVARKIFRVLVPKKSGKI